MTEDRTPPIIAAIDAIYAAAQDRREWRMALERIASATGSAGASLGYFELGEKGMGFATSTAFSDESIGYYARELATEDPITPLVQHAPVGVTSLSHEVLDPRTWTRSRMYAELYEPHYLLSAMAGVFTRERDCFGTLILMQDRSMPRFEREQARLVDMLLPHVARSMRVSQLLVAGYAEGEIAGRYTAIFLDRRGDVVAVGPRAEAILRTTSVLAIRDRRVRSTDERVDHWLGQVGASGLANTLPQRALDMSVHSGPCWLQDGSATCRLEAVSCPDLLHSWIFPGPSPTILLLLDRRTLAENLPPSLCEVAELIAEGLADKEIAERTGRPLSTIRTYVARLYERTHLRSRAAITKWWWTSR